MASYIASGVSEKLMVSLRDGRKLIGVLRSWDQYGTAITFRFLSDRGRCLNLGLMRLVDAGSELGLARYG